MSDTDAPWPTTTPEARLTSAPDKVSARDSLTPGTRLGEFEVVRVLGTGGFGIVYLARDHVLQRDVAIKEYMPAVLARRGEGATVSMRSSGCAETFARGLESFLSEARLLASFDHPSLVKVHRFWRANATAYMAMQYYPGRTLKEARSAMAAPPGEAWLDAFVQPILGALELLHGEGVFHRDIAPDNIMMLPDGQPVLLDFGCARRVVAHAAQAFTAHLKPQFAPVEQYADEAGLRQGPWTDLYSLGATLHFVLTGRAPTPSVVRAVRDVLPTLSSLGPASFPQVPARWLATVDWTLALAPDARPQDVATVRRALRGEIAPPPLPPRQPVLAAGSETAPPPRDASDASAGGHDAPAARPGARDDRLVVPGLDAPVRRAPAGRGMSLGAAASLAFLSVAALGWSLYASRGAAAVAPTELGVAASLPREEVRAVPAAVAAPLSVPPVALATLAAATTAVAATATAAAPTTALAPRAAATPSPAPVAVFSRGPDPVALRVSTNAPHAAPARDPPRQVASLAPERRPEAAPLQATPARPPTGARAGSVRGRQRTAGAPITPLAQAGSNVCSGIVAGALCVLNPCKNPRTRSGAQCLDRQRAEEMRLRRMERL